MNKNQVDARKNIQGTKSYCHLKFDRKASLNKNFTIEKSNGVKFLHHL